jgi:ketosteroid isomerase-like protein
MKTYLSLFVFTFCCVVGCQQSNTVQDFEKWEAEIMDVEKAFNDMAQEKGLIEAFEFYAAENGVIRRGKKVIKGKKAIADWYKNDVRPNETLTWIPTYIEVSNTGDMAFTYGDYIFTSLDSLGKKKESKGIFHTVWRRQTDGTWRFVWD